MPADAAARRAPRASLPHPPTTPRPAAPAPAPAPPRGRTLRARPSDPGPGPSSAPAPTGSARALAPDELARIGARLGDGAVAARRAEVVAAQEAELTAVLDAHDTAVRERFHLERYVSLIDGWDPVALKSDNSPVFTEWRDARYNLLALLPSTEAGPSRRGAARTTRRQAHEQNDALMSALPAPPAPAAPANGHAPTPAGASAASAAGKGKGKAGDEPAADKPRLFATLKEAAAYAAAQQAEADEAAETAEAARAAAPTGRKGKARGRETAEADDMRGTPGKGAKANGKGRDRNSRATMDAGAAPARPPKRLKLALADSPSASPAPVSSPQIPEPTPASSPSPPPPPTPLPSLAHLPFPPPPVRPRERRAPRQPASYTDPSHLPAPAPRHGGSVAALLESYVSIDDGGPALDLPALEARARRDAYLRNRVNQLQQQGRLRRLLDDDAADADAAGPAKPGAAARRPPPPPARQQDHHDALVAHALQIRGAVVAEAKFKPQACRRIARMVAQHWEHEQGRDERARLAEEREMKKRAKDLVRAVRKKWGMAIKVIRARKLAAQKLEQDRLGKQHLQNMLQRSTGLLEAQRDDIAGRDDDEGSDGTADEDPAEASDEDGDGDDGESAGAARSEAALEADAADDAEADAMDVDGEAADGTDEDDADGESSDEDDDDDDDGGERDSDSEDDGAADGDTAERFVDLRALLGDGAAGAPDIDGDAPASSIMDVSDIAAAPAADAVEQGGTALIEAVAVRVDGDGEVQDAKSTGVAAIVGVDVALAAASPRSADAPEQKPDADLRADTPVENASSKAGAADDVLPPQSLALPTPPLRSRRARQPRAAPAAAVEADPDAHDGSFSDGAEVDAQDAQDEQMDVDMDAADEEDRDSEDQGLLDDANVPIEELLRRYGYPVPAEAEGKGGDAEPEDEAVHVNGDGQAFAPALADQSAADAAGADGTADDVKVDQSLTDASIEARGPSPTLIVEGKRQRRTRTVWSPVDNPTPAPSKPKAPKIEVVESTPELSDDESEDGDDDDGGDDDADSGGGEAEGMAGLAGGAEAADGFKIRPPFLLRGTLRPYQHAGLEWLAALYANNMNGILADEMGLGKTIQTISLLAHLACDRGVWGQHLVIVPTSVILNWEMEFKKFLPGFKVLTYYGNQKERRDKRVGWHTENAWQVCITSYQIVLADQHIFRRKNWEYMILDEAHNIKNFRSQRWQTLLGFKAQRRLLLTGTPLQNNLMELWSLLYFLMPNGVTEDATSVVGFANHKEFTEWFSNPMDKAVESGEAIDDDMRETVGKLHTLLRPFILRRLKSEVETQLPGKFEHVVYCKLSKRQRFLYDEFMGRASTKEALSSGGYLGVVNTLMQLRKVCNHPDLFEVRPVRTSFAMDPVAQEYGPAERVVRRLLGDADVAADALRHVTANEHESGWAAASRARLDASDRLPAADPGARAPPRPDTRTVDGWRRYRAWADRQASLARWRALAAANRARVHRGPIYGATTLALLGSVPRLLLPADVARRRAADLFANEHDPPAAPLVLSHEARARACAPLIEAFAVAPPNAVARGLPAYALPALAPAMEAAEPALAPLRDPAFDTLHHPAVKLQIAFPDASLLQYDCGKLQKLDEMLRALKADGHRVLIFTQMTRVLDILETFLSYNGHRYLRLDGSTKIEDRQAITERFNSDARVFCFIASSRSGGVGINLTGADTVFFYDSDWNPSMDRQCMDRAHRIGQTREVHIYRFVSMHTVEENMLKKANQKRLLDRVVIQEGDFTTDFFGKMDWRDMLDSGGGAAGMGAGAADAAGHAAAPGGARIEDVELEGTPVAVDAARTAPRVGHERELARALAEVEDEEDAAAAAVAQGEGELDLAEFVEGQQKKAAGAPAPAAAGAAGASSGAGTPVPAGKSQTPVARGAGADDGAAGEVDDDDEGDGEQDDDEDDVGAVDEYMLRLIEWDWEHFAHV